MPTFLSARAPSLQMHLLKFMWLCFYFFKQNVPVCEDSLFKATYMNRLSSVDENFCQGTRGAREEGWPSRQLNCFLSLCLAPAFSHGSDDNRYVVRMRSDMLSHSLQGACAHVNKATPAVPALCLDHLLSDATIAFCYNPNPPVSTPVS